MGTCQPVQSPGVFVVVETPFVDHDLDVVQQLGDILDLVDQHRGHEMFDERTWILFRLLTDIGIIKRHIFSFRLGDAAQERSLADLSGAGEHDGRKESASGFNDLRQVSWDVHGKPRLIW